MGGGVAYMQFIFRQALKNNLNVRFVGVDKKTDLVREKYHFISLMKNNDDWRWFFVKLFFRTPFLKFTTNEVVHTFRILYAFPLVLFHPKLKVVCVTAEPLISAKLRHHKTVYKLIEFIFNKIELFVLKRISYLCTSKEIYNNYFKKKYSTKLFNNKLYLSTAAGIDTSIFKPMNKNSIREKFGFKKSDKILLYVGRLDPIKRIDFIIDIFNELYVNDNNNHLVIAGTGPSEDELKILVKNKNLPNVHFLGKRTKTELSEIYNLADVLILTSFSEGNPTVVREAICCHVPVISTNVGDVKEIINDSSIGIVIDDFYDKHKFVEGIKLLNNNKNFKEKNFQKLSKYFSEEEMFNTIMKLYIKSINEDIK
jgi:glycosyltransferase involved in cell wall biosynthesis